MRNRKDGYSSVYLRGTPRLGSDQIVLGPRDRNSDYRGRLYPSLQIDRECLIRDVFDYIDMFYNPKRKHVRNGMLSPVEFERQQEM